jgi:N-acetylneuraminic acid mutarotase
VERYSFETNRWEFVSDLDRPIKALAAVALPDGIYAIGGFDSIEQSYSTSMRRFDYKDSSWH